MFGRSGLNFGRLGLASPGAIDPILAIFADGTDGFYFDFSKTDRLFQAATGPTAVSAAGQNIGLALESSRWGSRELTGQLAQATELISNPGGPFAATTGWAATGATLSVVSDNLRITSTGAGFPGRAVISFTTVVGRTYPVEVTLPGDGTGGPGAIRVGTSDGGTQNGSFIPGAGTSRHYIQATATTTYVSITTSATAGQYVNLSLCSAKLIERNHGIQSTSAAQPKWQTGGVARFDGTDDCLVSSLTLGATANTFMAKLTVGAGAAARGIMGFVSADRFNLSIGTGGVLQLGYGTNGALITSPVDLRGSTGVAAATHDASNVYLYWNASLIGSAPREGVHSTSVTVPFGCYRHGSTGTLSGFFPGDANNALAIKKALTAAEIAAITNKWGTS